MKTYLTQLDNLPNFTPIQSEKTKPCGFWRASSQQQQQQQQRSNNNNNDKMSSNMGSVPDPKIHIMKSLTTLTCQMNYETQK